VMYPDHFLEWDDASRFLSTSLQKTVFSFHIHDGDLWMYLLFKNGAQVDQFNPRPNYWDEDANSASDPLTWSGNANVVSQYWPNVRPEQIARYLIQWENDADEESRGKAYPEDEFEIGIDWQMADFMAQIGLVIPADEAEKDISCVTRAQFSILDTKPPVKAPEVKNMNWWQRLFKSGCGSPRALYRGASILNGQERKNTDDK